MLTKKDSYQKAFEMKKTTRTQNERERELLLAAAYRAMPRLGEIDGLLAKVGADLAMTAMSGDSAGIEKLKQLSLTLSAEKAALLKKAKVKPAAYDCPLCRDTGYVSGKICGCVKELVKSISVKELSREMPLESCRFDNFNLDFYPDSTDKDGANPRRRMTGILGLCRDYAENFDPNHAKNLLFMGDSGLGKTHLTLAIVSGVIHKGFMPVYGSAANLFSAVEREKFSGTGTQSYDTMINCDLLVIDDLGAEFSNSFTQSLLYNLINTRLLSGLPTVINTNLTMAQIEERYTGRIASRLIGEYVTKKFCGVDIRQCKRGNALE